MKKIKRIINEAINEAVDEILNECGLDDEKYPSDEILINPETGQEYINVPATVAAKYLDVSLRLVYEGLQKKALPIGSAIQSDKGRWTYNIPVQLLKAYAYGLDMQPFG